MDLGKAKPTLFLATSREAEARFFYSQVLGLPLRLDDKYALVYQVSGVELRISKIPDHKPLSYTMLDWQVDDIHSAWRTLSDRHVEFVIFENMDQDERGIWSSPDGKVQILWFKDPDGNVLSISQRD